MIDKYGSAAGGVLAVLALSSPAAAQNQPTLLDPLVITGSPLGLTRAETVEGTTVLEGDRLDRNRGLSLGEALDDTPGVSSTAFGPGASRPVIRGQGGPRVRVLDNGIDTFDVSVTSPDHAVTAPLFGAQRVEVLRGPATLLYGGGAVAGVVNVIDNKIAERRPEKPISAEARVGYGSGADDRNAAAQVTATAGQVVVHAQGFTQDAHDYRVRGFANQAGIDQGVRGRVLNSDVESDGGAGGISVVGERGFGGLAITRFTTLYGVPGDEPVEIDMRQTRYDFRMGLNEPLPFLEHARLELGGAEYRHAEIEDGEVGTRFRSVGLEGRLELTHVPIGPVRGVLGFQAMSRRLKVIGDEAFLPQTDTRSHAVFLLEHYETGPWLFSAGGRLERQTVDADAVDAKRQFTAASVSGSATYRFEGGYNLGFTLSRTERAPTAEELFSNGPHLATQSFEVGDTTLSREKALHAELSLRKVKGDVTGAVNVFATRYSDYVFSQFTGAVDGGSGLPILQYGQTGADFLGAELELAWIFLRTGKWEFGVDASLDLVHARDRRADDPLPRIPPLGYKAGLTAGTDFADFRLEVQGAARQDRNGPGETETDGYTFLNAGVLVRPWPEAETVTLSLQGRNLTDARGRNHVSLLKDDAPLRGREVLLTAHFKL